MNNKTVLLLVGVGLIFIGLFKPSLDVPVDNSVIVDNVEVFETPKDSNLKELCLDVAQAFKTGSSTRKKDAKRLSELYADLAQLISLDDDDEAIKTTEEIRQANSLSGIMLRLNIKGLYPQLGSASQKVLVSQIGDDIVPLDKDLRKKAVEAFKGLSWACNEGSK